MALIEWNQAYSVKVQRFDDQHKKLFELINQLHLAMMEGRGEAVLGDVIQSLIIYTEAHFGEEIKTLQANGYPELAKHKAEHDKFVAQVLDLRKKFQTGHSLLTVSTQSLLKDWLVNHIQKEDSSYSPFLNAKGLS